MKWTREEIRTARQAPLKPLLEQRGYTLNDTGAGNSKLLHPTGEIILKANYWRSPDTGQAGNTIDFFVKVEHLAFAEAMRILTASQ